LFQNFTDSTHANIKDKIYIQCKLILQTVFILWHL